LRAYFKDYHFVEKIVYVNAAYDIEEFYEVAEKVDQFGKQLQLVESFCKEKMLSKE